MADFDPGEKKMLMSSERVLIFKNVKFAKSMYGFPIMSSSITKGSILFSGLNAITDSFNWRIMKFEVHFM